MKIVRYLIWIACVIAWIMSAYFYGYNKGYDCYLKQEMEFREYAPVMVSIDGRFQYDNRISYERAFQLIEKAYLLGKDEYKYFMRREAQ